MGDTAGERKGQKSGQREKKLNFRYNPFNLSAIRELANYFYAFFFVLVALTRGRQRNDCGGNR